MAQVRIAMSTGNTVEPLYNGHYWEPTINHEAIGVLRTYYVFI